MTEAETEVQIFSPGILGAIIWPTYMGVATGDPGPPGRDPQYEPFDDFNYQRGQITWHTEPSGLIWGEAAVLAPLGIYTHFVFCHGPIRHMMIGMKPIPGDPIIFNRPGVIEIKPIRNTEYLPRGVLG